MSIRETSSSIHCPLPYVQEILRPALHTTSEFPVFSPASKQGEWNREEITISRCWSVEREKERRRKVVGRKQHVFEKSVVLVVSVVWLQL